ncbi:hypothetical protein C7999DRAFT_40837 [Corynascus novoguineensis]|uniref:3-carboxymuconate cyclase n=1 Tax=Corynascus novoguineensis TaxID=1126955 RepID=A0AAN7HJB7_9PEZI|nr:hypothetical protein C7999DRAFT_40837 [Corynascus novoguineensis]
MSPLSRPWLSLAALCSLSPALFNALSLAAPQQIGGTKSSVGRAVYFITNRESNAVVALPIGANGQLSPGTVTPTDGAGAIALNSNNEPATPDALASQSALAIAGNTIFAVNAGSNTLSMLAISPSDPTELHLVGKPVPIPGDFPNTVAASKKHNLVCVGTSGARAGVSCGRFSAKNGLDAMDELRSFDLGRKTPPVATVDTISQVFFSDTEDALFATVKGNPAANKTTFFASFSVENDRGPCSRTVGVSRVKHRSTPKDTMVLFGSQPIPSTQNVFVTDAAFGVAILAIDAYRGKATTVATREIPGQAASCWVTISPATGTAFVADGGVNRLVELSVRDASILSELDLSCNGDPGLLDLSAAGDFVYALSPGNGTTPAAITVVRVSSNHELPMMVQHFQLDGVADKRAMGMAVLL